MNDLIPFGELCDEAKGKLLLAHHEDNHSIEEYNPDTKGWSTIYRPVWYTDLVFRIKPEPRVIYINSYPNSLEGPHYTLAAARKACCDIPKIKTIKFIEVLEN